MKSVVFSVVIVLGAYGADLLVGDPRFIPHPVVGMGRAISWLESKLWDSRYGERRQKAVGALAVAWLVLGTYVFTASLCYVMYRWHPALGWITALSLTTTTVAAKGLHRAVMAVVLPLKRQALPEAREALSHIVGRDTDTCDEVDVLRATVETVAENTVDAITSPLFYAALGGPALAMAYRMVNTLDSMWGYKNERYRCFGWAAARLDDAANWLPARLTALLLPVAAWMTGHEAGNCWRMMRRDAGHHPSPNAGLAEAGTAGALGVRLGGWNTYKGKPEFRAYLGDEARPLEPGTVVQALRLMHGVSVLFVVVLVGCALLTAKVR